MIASAGEKMAPVLRGIAENRGTQDPPYDTNTWTWTRGLGTLY